MCSHLLDCDGFCRRKTLYRIILLTEQRMLREDEYPLVTRVMLGPHEDVAKLYLMDRTTTDEISPEVAQFLNLSMFECNAIMEQFNSEQAREERRILTK